MALSTINYVTSWSHTVTSAVNIASPRARSNTNADTYRSLTQPHSRALRDRCTRVFGESRAIRKTGAMSTIEETPLQPRDSKATEDSNHTSCTEQLESLQVEDASGESAQGISSSAKVTVAPVTTNGWKKCFITVTILITYAFLNAGISVIAPFYPIVVSFLACMVGREAFY